MMFDHRVIECFLRAVLRKTHERAPWTPTAQDLVGVQGRTLPCEAVGAQKAEKARRRRGAWCVQCMRNS